MYAKKFMTICLKIYFQSIAVVFIFYTWCLLFHLFRTCQSHALRMSHSSPGSEKGVFFLHIYSYPHVGNISLGIRSSRLSVASTVPSRSSALDRMRSSCPQCNWNQNCTYTIWGIPSFVMFCYVFFRKFWLHIGLHSGCSISPTAGEHVKYTW